MCPIRRALLGALALALPAPVAACADDQATAAAEGPAPSAQGELAGLGAGGDAGRGGLAVGRGFVGLGTGGVAERWDVDAEGDLVHGATAVLRGPDGTPVGRVAFAAHGPATLVTVRIEGLEASPGHHGFHIHANDDPANGSGCIADPIQPPETWFAAVDGHLGAETGWHPGHRGDMPSVLVGADGTAMARFLTDRVTVGELAEAAVVLHAHPDNFGNVPTGDAPDQYTPNGPTAREATAATGNAGPRIACGVVGS